NIASGARLQLGMNNFLGWNTNTFNNALNVGSASGGTAEIFVSRGAAAFNGPVVLAAGGHTPLLHNDRRSAFNSTFWPTTPMQFTGGFSGTGDIVMSSTVNPGERFILSGGTINNVGALTLQITNTGNIADQTISAPIGPNVTSLNLSNAGT